MSLTAVSDQEAVARAALAELTPDRTVGNLLDRVVEDDGVTTLSFEARLSGYPGWHWSVSLAELPGEDATVLEAELLPGPGALLAPDWVPWAERLEEYRAAQAAAAAERAESGGEDDDGDDDLDDEELEDDDLGDEELDDDLDEDDLGDDPDDGIDFEGDDSAVSLGRVDEEDESEDESHDDRPEEPAEA